MRCCERQLSCRSSNHKRRGSATYVSLMIVGYNAHMMMALVEAEAVGRVSAQHRRHFTKIRCQEIAARDTGYRVSCSQSYPTIWPTNQMQHRSLASSLLVAIHRSIRDISRARCKGSIGIAVGLVGRCIYTATLGVDDHLHDGVLAKMEILDLNKGSMMYKYRLNASSYTCLLAKAEG